MNVNNLIMNKPLLIMTQPSKVLVQEWDCFGTITPSQHHSQTLLLRCKLMFQNAIDIDDVDFDIEY